MGRAWYLRHEHHRKISLRFIALANFGCEIEALRIPGTSVQRRQSDDIGNDDEKLWPNDVPETFLFLVAVQAVDN